MNAAVVGAGIGGLAAAVGLQRIGYDCVVFEEADALRLSGAGVTIWPNGAQALIRLGISIDGLGRRMDRLETRSAEGRLLYAIDGRRLADRFGVPVMMVPRRDLLERLADALAPGSVLFGRKCERVESGQFDAAVSFADHQPESAGLVVGSDGHRSAVRRSLFGDGSAQPTGWIEWQGLTAVPTSVTNGAVSVVAVEKTGACALIPAGENLTQWWFAMPNTPATRTPSSVVAMLRQRFGGWLAPVSTLLDGLSDQDANLWIYVRHRVPSSLFAHRVVLVGDAAHAMPPTLGQGANQALEDAATLSTALSLASPDAGLVAYDRARRHKSAVVSRLARRAPAQDPAAWSTRLTARVPVGVSTWAFGSLLQAVSTVLT